MGKTKAAEPALASFDIFVLGTRSSGKSVMLASLYRQLSVMDGLTSFFARCEDGAQHRELVENCNQLLDVEADWPSGTYQVESFDMRCYHRVRGRNLPVFSIRFHDYPGGYVTSQVERREFIEERVEQCTTVMALIDGRKLLDRLQNSEVNPAYALHRDLDSLVRVLQLCVGKPIHFVLTKADLLAPSRYPLKDIIAELKKHKGFADIVAQQKNEGTGCYIVPVSAVGPNFSRIDPADGLIKKRPDGTIEPTYLDVMTSVSLVDTVLDLARRPASNDNQDSIFAKLHRWVGNKLIIVRVGATAASPVLGPFGVAALQVLLLASDKLIADRNRSFQEKVRDIQRDIQDQSSALDAIIKIQFQLLDRFLRKFPVSCVGASFDPASWSSLPKKAGPIPTVTAPSMQQSVTAPPKTGPVAPPRAGAGASISAPKPTLRKPVAPPPTRFVTPRPSVGPKKINPTIFQRVGEFLREHLTQPDRPPFGAWLALAGIAGAFALAAVVALMLATQGPHAGRVDSSWLRLLYFSFSLALARLLAALIAATDNGTSLELPADPQQVLSEMWSIILSAPTLLAVMAIVRWIEGSFLIIPLLLVAVAIGDRQWVRFTAPHVDWRKVANVFLLAMTIIAFWVNADAMYSSYNQSLTAAVLILNCAPPLVRMVTLVPDDDEDARSVSGVVWTNLAASGVLCLAIATCLSWYH